MATANGGNDDPVCSEAGVQFSRAAIAGQTEAGRNEGARGLSPGGPGGDNVTVGLNREGEGARIVSSSAEVGDRNSLFAESEIDAAVGIIADDSKTDAVVDQRRARLTRNGAAHHNFAVTLQHQSRCRDRACRSARSAKGFVDSAVGIVAGDGAGLGSGEK